MLVHDSFSSIGVTLALLTRAPARATGATLAGRAAWPSTRAGRAGFAGERVLDLGRHLAELPWFARNVAIKVLVLAGRRRGRSGSGSTRPPMALLSARISSATPATATQWTAMRSIEYSGL